MVQALRQRFPDLQVEGGNYPPPALNSAIASALGYGKLFAIAALVIADKNMAAEAGPEWFKWMRENKVWRRMGESRSCW